MYNIYDDDDDDIDDDHCNDDNNNDNDYHDSDVSMNITRQSSKVLNGSVHFAGIS